MVINGTVNAAQRSGAGPVSEAGAKGVLDPGHIKVHRIMMPSHVTVPPDFSVAETLAVLQRHRLQAAAVVDGNGRMMGVVTLAQIDRMLAVLSRLRRMSAPDHGHRSNLQALPGKGESHVGKILDASEG